MSALVEIKDVCKVYNPGENEVRALDHVSLTIDEQEFVAIIGHSGSGKSTLMNMLGCLDVPTHGVYRLNGRDVGILAAWTGRVRIIRRCIVRHPEPGDRVYLSGL